MSDYRENPSYLSAEIQHIKELLEAFGTGIYTEPQQILKLISTRYKFLEESQRRMAQHKLFTSDSCRFLAQFVHAYLYIDIFTNAGQIRKITDPSPFFGQVGFGGTHYSTHKEKFIGTPPDQIEDELAVAFQILFENGDTFPSKAIRFYAEFVAVHPYYDANGRIGRYIVDIYLLRHGYYVRWSDIANKYNKFLRKLNACHMVRLKQKQCLCASQINYWHQVRKKYLSYLTSFWSEFVESVENFEDI